MAWLFEKFFGIELKSDEDKSDKQQKLKSFIPPTKRDGTITIDPGQYGAYFYSTPYQSNRIANEFELITKYRQMSMHPLIDKAIEEICNEAIVSDETGNYKLELNLDDVKDISENVKQVICDEFDNILKIIRYSSRAYEFFRQFYIDGRLSNLILIDEDDRTNGIQDVRLIDPRQIQKIRLIKRDPNSLAATGNGDYGSSAALVKFIDNIDEFFVYNPYGIYTATINNPTEAAIQGIKIEPSSVSFITSGLLDSENTIVLSFLEKVSIILNNLTDLESAILIYRLSRSSSKRVFYIDVAKMAHTKAMQYVKQIAEKYKTRLVYDPTTGKIEGKNALLSLTEDFFIPVREGSATKIETLDGSPTLDQLPDLDYFYKLLIRSLGVPSSRFEAATGFNLGKSSEITRDEIGFKKFITRLQNKFGEFPLQLLKTNLEIKGIMSSQDFEVIEQDIKLDFQTDNFFYEMKESEILSIRAATAKDLSDVNEAHQIFSSKWIKNHIFKLTDEQIHENDAQIALERKQRALAGIENPEEEGSAGGGNSTPMDPNTPIEDLTPEPESKDELKDTVSDETGGDTKKTDVGLESFASIINDLNNDLIKTDESDELIEDIVDYIISKKV